MTTTLTPNETRPNGSSSQPLGLEPAPRRHRSLPLALLAVGCMLASIVAFVGVQLASGDRTPVLAVARPVAAGAQITDEDLRVAQVASDPAISPIPLSGKASVIRRTAAVDLEPGTLLVESALGPSSAVDDGEALVGVEVPAIAAPVGAIHEGDRVRVVEVDKSTDGGDAEPGEVIAEGRVLRIASAGSGAATTSQLALVVPESSAAAVASASVGQRLAVVVVP